MKRPRHAWHELDSPSQSIDDHEDETVEGRGRRRAIFGDVAILRQPREERLIGKEARREGNEGDGY